MGTEHALVVNNVSKSFGGVRAIDNVSLVIDQERSRVLIGPNGAGKTTLFNLITGEIPIDSGEIYIFGFNVSKCSVQKRSELGLARTYQICNLFKEITVEENIYLALKSKEWNEQNNMFSFITPWQKNKNRMKRIKEVIKIVALEDNKSHTLVSSLSHGEQRQLELGIAIAPNPKIVLIDEPMAGLSPTERGFISKLISKLAQEKIICVIEHDMDFALSITNNITVLDHGKVMAEGSPEEIKRNREVNKIYGLE
ncbi:MAG: ABC transporter ATP-binding protein [Candidatus Humimicrobiaceae bacterium]